ncbi:MAG: uracil-DNA glycosylase [Gammaproteobacteria bacterium]|nr:uracil-DNA glycosylase [Gammaproteobacteria bacterium]
MTDKIISQLLESSAVHDEWIKPLTNALLTVDSAYLKNLFEESNWLPGPEKIFAAFQRDLSHCEYILFGESPYPRAESANGIAFYDAAVTDLWSETGLSKGVNKATSLRNIMKTALLAEGLIETQADGKIPQSTIARLNKQNLIQNIGQFFLALRQKGFLLLNATPALHPDRKPLKEARYWSGFVNQLLTEIQQVRKDLPTLVLWGQIAQQIDSMPASSAFPIIRCEHPYNISFITNKTMLQFFKQLKLLSSKNI